MWGRQTLSLTEWPGHFHLYLFMLNNTAFMPTLCSYCEGQQYSHVEHKGRVLSSLFSVSDSLPDLVCSEVHHLVNIQRNPWVSGGRITLGNHDGPKWWLLNLFVLHKRLCQVIYMVIVFTSLWKTHSKETESSLWSWITWPLLLR